MTRMRCGWGEDLVRMGGGRIDDRVMMWCGWGEDLVRLGQGWCDDLVRGRGYGEDEGKMT